MSQRVLRATLSDKKEGEKEQQSKQRCKLHNEVMRQGSSPTVVAVVVVAPPRVVSNIDRKLNFDDLCPSHRIVRQFTVCSLFWQLRSAILFSIARLLNRKASLCCSI